MPKMPATVSIWTAFAPAIGARAEDVERHERVGDARLPRDERHQQRQRERAQAERPRRAPAVVRGLENRVDQEHQRRRDERAAHQRRRPLVDRGPWSRST